MKLKEAFVFVLNLISWSSLLVLVVEVGNTLCCVMQSAPWMTSEITMRRHLSVFKFGHGFEKWILKTCIPTVFVVLTILYPVISNNTCFHLGVDLAKM